MGVLTGFKIVEISGIGPVPWCGMLLADMGADVIRIDRVGEAGRSRRAPKFEAFRRGRHRIEVDLKTAHGVATVLNLVKRSHALIEGMRPGVMERLGLGPEPCLAANPRLAYGRMTGWGQDGPLAQRAGHDINYIALAGALHSIGACASPPVPPLNLVADLGGGGAFLAIGILAAMLNSRSNSRGQVVDVAMVDGVASLMAMVYGLHSAGEWRDARGENSFDGGAPWYGVYETKDGAYMAVGAIEPKFYAEFLEGLGLTAARLPERSDRANWPMLRRRFADAFKARTRREWAGIFQDKDACVTPVLSLAEAPVHPHLVARRTFVDVDGAIQPGVAPRFRETPSQVSGAAGSISEGRDALRAWGLSDEEIELAMTDRT